MATTDIISSLFGITPTVTPEQAENNARERALSIGGLWGAATALPYDDPARRQGYIQQQASQYALGDMLGRNLFGIEAPELKRASTIEGTLAGLQDELTAEQMQDPTQLYPALIKRLQGAGLNKEAMMVARQASDEIAGFNLAQAKIGKENAEALKASTTKSSNIGQLIAERNQALAAGDMDTAQLIHSKIMLETTRDPKSTTPENQAEAIILNKYIKELGPEEGALAFATWKNAQKKEVSSVQGTGAFDDKGNFTSPTGQVVPKEQMIDYRNSQDASVQLLDRLSMLDEKDIDLAFGKIFDTTQQGVTQDLIRLGANEEVVGAQYKVNNIGVREVLKNLQDLKGASSDKEMSRVASTFPGFSADPKVMKEWAARAMFTTLRFVNENKEKYGFDAPPVDFNDIINNPMFKYLSPNEKGKYAKELMKYDPNFSKFNDEGKQAIIKDLTTESKVINGVKYIKDAKGWKVAQ